MEVLKYILSFIATLVNVKFFRNSELDEKLSI